MLEIMQMETRVGSSVKFYIIFFFILLLFVQTNALQSKDNYCTVIGYVRDVKTIEPLAGANVSIESSNIGAETDRNGKFEIRLSAGRYKLIISYIGYQKYERKIIIKSGTEKYVVDAALEPVVLPGKELTVTAEKLESEIARYEIKARELQTMASPLPEVLLSLKTLPGVSSLNDQSSFYNVRGGNYDENLIYINDVEIYQPHLVRKGIAENPSLINPNMIKSINLRTGAFSVSYGDKLSSVLDVTYQDNYSRRFTAYTDIGAIGFNVSFSGKFSNNISSVFAIRKINYGYLFGSLHTKGNYRPDFQDVQGLINFKPLNNLKFTILSISAESRYQAEPTKLEIWNYSYGNYEMNFSSGKENYCHSTRLLSLNTNYDINRYLKLKWINTYIKQHEHENTNLNYILLSRGILIINDVIVPSQQPGDYGLESGGNEYVNNRFEGKYYTSKMVIDFTKWSPLTINTGFELKYFDIKDYLSQYKHEEIGDEIILISPTDNLFNNSNRTGYILGRFLQVKLKLTKKFDIQTGLRWTKSSLNNEQLFMPRIRALWYLSDISEIIFAAGKYSQPPIYKEFMFRDKEDYSLLSQKSTQFTIGYKRYFQDNQSIKIEGFYKKLSDLISYDLKDVRIKYSGENDAVGYAFGFDVYYHWKPYPDKENWISYSFLVSKEDLLFDDEGFVPRPSDRGHQLAFYLEDRMVRFPGSKLYLRIIFGTGYPYTQKFWKYDEETKTYEKREGRRNYWRMRYYERFDIGFTLEFIRYKNFCFVVRGEVLNLFDHTNVLSYEQVGGHIIKHFLSGRTYNFGARLEF